VLTEGPAAAAYDDVQTALTALSRRQDAHIVRQNEHAESVVSSARTDVIVLLAIALAEEVVGVTQSSSSDAEEIASAAEQARAVAE
jgi:hypothetical protein